MSHFFFQRLQSLAGVLLVLLLEKVVRLGDVVVCRGLGEIVVRPPSALLIVNCSGVGVGDRFWEDPSCNCL